MTRTFVVRTLATAAVIGLVVPAAAAGQHATKKRKPVCNLVKDGSGDATGTGTAVTGPNDGNLDIVGADVATNARTLTAVVRLAALSSSDSNSPGGREYQVVFTVGTATTGVDAVVGPTGTATASGGGTALVDAAKKQVRISVPLSALEVKVAPSTPLTRIGARTYRVLGNDQIVLGNTDSADSASSYTPGWPSCVKVGA